MNNDYIFLWQKKKEDKNGIIKEKKKLKDEILPQKEIEIKVGDEMQ